MELRAAYAQLNATFRRKRIYQYGRGFGFCAETVGLLKAMLSCLSTRTQLVVATHPLGMGFSMGGGWGDYFEELFPTRSSPWLHRWNREYLAGGSLIPGPARRLLRAGLRAIAGADRMQFDAPELPARLVVPELGLDLDWWGACAFCLDLMWVYRADVVETIEDEIGRARLPASYLGVHVRRGDKSTEARPVPLESYARAITARCASGALLVASDDPGVASDLGGLLGPAFDVRSLAGDASGPGHVQGDFNRLPPEERRRRTVRLLTELEALGRADTVLLTTSSNVGSLLQYARGNRGVVDVA